MSAKRVDLQETDLKELIALVKEGTEILLTKDGVPVAWMLPINPPENPRIPDLFPGIATSDDFDDPLSDK